LQFESLACGLDGPFLRSEGIKSIFGFFGLYCSASSSLYEASLHFTEFGESNWLIMNFFSGFFSAYGSGTTNIGAKNGP
jgi:hypothetical protein